MTLPDFLRQLPDGEIVLAGHRIGLYHVIRYYNEGYSPEMLLGQYPTLSLALIHKVIAYYLENREEADAYVGRCEGELSRLRREGAKPDWATLRERLDAMRRAEGVPTAQGPDAPGSPTPPRRT